MGLPVSSSYNLGVRALGRRELEKLGGLVDGGLGGALGEEVGCQVCGVARCNALAGDSADSCELQSIADGRAG